MSDVNPPKKPYGIKELLKDVVIVVGMYLLFSTFGYASFHIPSSSMEPTLEVGDRVFVAKFPYGFNRYSFFFDPDAIGEDRTFEDLPERGDIVVFSRPDLENTDFIKRVIGLPGDTIALNAGRLYINNKLVEREAVGTFSFTSYQGTRRTVTEYIETLPNGREHRIYESSDADPSDFMNPYVVPEDHYFMMGDNRDVSGDSRNLRRMGPVHKKYLVGRADITTFSFYDCGQGKPNISCPGGVPVGRFFVGLD